MSFNIRFTNNIGTVKSSFRTACVKALEMCGSTGEGYAKLACPVDTGALRNSISHKVDDTELKCYIGTNQEYAPYVELGTGLYCTIGGGRSDPWVYKDGKGEWHMTNGQRAQPYLKPAVADHTDTYEKIIEETLKGG